MYTQVRLLHEALNMAKNYLNKGYKVEITPLSDGYEVRSYR
ncbi:hypothetical protein [Bacillus haynesii]|nr:hypothetical protein [Bacillus haynesii]